MHEHLIKQVYKTLVAWKQNIRNGAICPVTESDINALLMLIEKGSNHQYEPGVCVRGGTEGKECGA